MSLNNIQFSSFQLAELYGKNLVLPAGTEEPGTVSRPAVTPQQKQEIPATPSETTTHSVSTVTSPPPESSRVMPAPPAENTDPRMVPYLGKNQKKIAILVNNQKEVYLPESELSFLSSILLACQLHLGDVAIVNHARHPMSPDRLRQQLESEYILVFGVPVNDPALSQQPSFIPLSQNGYSIVLAPPLSQLNSTGPDAKLLKSKLWICLKQLFNV